MRSEHNNRFYRQDDGRILLGVFSGLGNYFQIDPMLLRILYCTALYYFPLLLVAYIAASIIFPRVRNTEHKERPILLIYAKRIRHLSRKLFYSGKELIGIGFGCLSALIAIPIIIGITWVILAVLQVKLPESWGMPFEWNWEFGDYTLLLPEGIIRESLMAQLGLLCVLFAVALPVCSGLLAGIRWAFHWRQFGRFAQIMFGVVWMLFLAGALAFAYWYFSHNLNVTFV